MNFLTMELVMIHIPQVREKERKTFLEHDHGRIQFLQNPNHWEVVIDVSLCLPESPLTVGPTKDK